MPNPRVEAMLKTAQEKLSSAAHLITVTYPLIKDKKMFSRALVLLAESIESGINASLLHAHYTEGLQITKKSDLDYQIWKQNRKKYDISSEELKAIDEIKFIGKRLKNSAMEFTRQDSLVILEESLEHSQINERRLREFLSIVRGVLLKIKSKHESNESF